MRARSSRMSRQRLDQAMKGLPPDVTYSIAYDRSALIERAVKTLEEKLIEESHRRGAGLPRCSCCTSAARWSPS